MTPPRVSGRKLAHKIGNACRHHKNGGAAGTARAASGGTGRRARSVLVLVVRPESSEQEDDGSEGGRGEQQECQQGRPQGKVISVAVIIRHEQYGREPAEASKNVQPCAAVTHLSDPSPLPGGG